MRKLWTRIYSLVELILKLMAKAHYHEYEVRDQNGNLIGYEGISRSGRVFWPVTESTPSQKDNSNQE